ncbi:TIGR03032 family protein [Crocinitomix algicola]|uniref:TIGR03032 family protein n=1 Tax=Crocinitomix algicola TaxID=1740263 RepID=UPI0009F5E6C9|nr:TIGR03032 family protein [Crocinitomix algicola]
MIEMDENLEYSKLQIEFTPSIAEILFDLDITILISTYQAGRVIALGSQDGAKLTQIPFVYKKPMGIAIQDEKLAIATLDEVHFLSSKGDIHKSKKSNEQNFDRFYVHRSTYNTNRLDIHDIEFGKGSLWGINTAFSCLCKFDINYSFVPKWKPNYITELVPEDRCHLNGLAMVDDVPKYVTALSQTNVKEGWREDIMGSGVLMEVPSGDVLLENLAMPHSPRMIEDELYVLESGAGRLLKVNPDTKTAELIYDFNRFIRGMAYKDGLLFIGASKIRETSKTFNGLAVKENSKHAGVIVFDLRSRTLLGSIDYLTTVDEIFDVQLLEGCHKPALINHKDDRIKEVITTPFGVFWLNKKTKEEAE